MVDYLTLGLSHGLLALALLRLVMREDLDSDPADSADLLDSADPVENTGRQPHA